MFNVSKYVGLPLVTTELGQRGLLLSMENGTLYRMNRTFKDISRKSLGKEEARAFAEQILAFAAGS